MASIIYLYSHPIQYFAPLNRALAEAPGVNLKVCYCSRQGLDAAVDPGFGIPVEWDIPLLEGYNAVFLPNLRAKQGPASFWSLVNPGIIKILWGAPRSYLIVHGWGYFTNILAIVFGRLFGHQVCLRGESPLRQELAQPKRIQFLKKLIFRYALFPLVHQFLFIGKQNKAFYQYHGVPERKLVFTPYAVDNARYQSEARALQPEKAAIRESLRIPADARVVLFSGKYVSKKRPLDLLRAFHQTGVASSFLIMLGEGELRAELEAYISEQQLENVLLTGFINQSALSRYYAAADIFVMCSGPGETWGLSTNEALNFGLPVLLSTDTGCADDLCQPGVNGYIFPTGDVEQLSARLFDLLQASGNQLRAMGTASRKIVADYSIETIVQNLTAAL